MFESRLWKSVGKLYADIVALETCILIAPIHPLETVCAVAEQIEDISEVTLSSAV